MFELDDDKFYLELLRAYIDSAHDAIFVLCDEMKFLVCNRPMEEWLGQTEAELIAHTQRIPITRLMGSDEAEAVFTREFEKVARGQSSRFELQIQPEAARPRWAEFQLSRVDLEVGTMVIGVARDIGERKVRHALLEHQLTHDQLTDLLNWNSFRECLQSTLEQRDGAALAVFIVGLRDFRSINHTLGHRVGDQVLVELAQRLQDLVQENGVLGRQGGDEFAVMIPGVDHQAALQWGRRIRRKLVDPVAVSLDVGKDQSELMTLDLNFGIGIALTPDHGVDGDTLLRRAGIALEQARTGSMDSAVYNPDADPHVRERLLLMGELRRAIEDDQLHLFVQPIVHLATGKPTGVEVLVRWNHPGRGWLDPEQFIPLAEQTGMVRALDAWVLHQSLAQLARWRSDGLDLSVSVNVSARTLEDTRFAEGLMLGLARHRIPPERVKLELTESALMADPEHSMEVLSRIAKQGVELALDDFGTGYSSLVYLRRFPLQVLKIDRSFVRELDRNENDAVIVRSTIELAHNLGLSVVAEGVADETVLAALRVLGCDCGQGYLLGKPQPAEEFRPDAPGDHAQLHAFSLV